jgi:hypothetical protein
MRRICVDACFLIGLCNGRDQYHAAAARYYQRLFEVNKNRMVIPWPILYETVRMGTVENRQSMRQLESHWRQMARLDLLELLSDCRYRDQVIQDSFDELRKPEGRQRNLSAVDRVLRNILSDTNLRIDAFITFNVADFSDVCGRFGRELLCDQSA